MLPREKASAVMVVPECPIDGRGGFPYLTFVGGSSGRKNLDDVLAGAVISKIASDRAAGVGTASPA